MFISRINKIIKFILKDIIELYPYILVFYGISFALSFFFESWNLFFYWPALHVSVVGLGFLIVVHYLFRNWLSIKQQFSLLFNEGKKAKKILKDSRNHVVVVTRQNIESKKSYLFLHIRNFIHTIISLLQIFIIRLIGLLRAVLKLLIVIINNIFIPSLIFIKKIVIKLSILIFNFTKWAFVNKLKPFLNLEFAKANYWRLSILFVIIVAAIFYWQVGIIDFLVLIYATLSILFIHKSKYSALVAMLLLVFCAISLVSDKPVRAENIAIYAYYFLIITVLTQFVEMRQWRISTDMSD